MPRRHVATTVLEEAALERDTSRRFVRLGEWVLLCSALACSGSPQGPTQVARDTVYVDPDLVDTLAFLEAGEILPMGALTVVLDGTRRDANGRWAYAGDTVIMRVTSSLSYRDPGDTLISLSYYEPITDTVIVPDTWASTSNSLRWYHPRFFLHRLIPAVLGVRWAADFSGPTVEVEIYAPHGFAGVTLPDVGVYLQACNVSDSCTTYITGFADGSPWHPDSSATRLQGSADLTGPWVGWPRALPPAGYGYGAWQATLQLVLEDDQGHRANVGCGGLLIPSPPVKLTCSLIFQR